MNAEIWSRAAQAERRSELYRLHRPLLHRQFDQDAQPQPGADTDYRDPRVAAWHSFAFFPGDETDVRLGNGLLRHTGFSPSYDFFMCALMQLYLRHRERFAPDVLEKAENCMALSGEPQAESPGFVGMNDNFGAMAVVVLVFLGELTDRPELLQNAIDKMRVLVGRLDQDGTISEFNSPTYTALTLCCMADIANYAKNEQARELALRIEQQTWYDVCARFHPGTSQMGGPSSRSYMGDSCGHMYNGRFAIHVAFGEGAQFVSPARYAYGAGADMGLVLHHNSPSFIPANGAWLAAGEYHPPDICGEMMLNRTYPFQVNGTASCGFVWRPDDWRHGPDGAEKQKFRDFEPYRYAPALLTTWHDADHTLATSSGAHACGGGSQHDAFFLGYRRRRPDPGERLGVEDVRTAFSRYVFNGEQPATESSLLVDDGRKVCVQQGGAAIVLYRPGIRILHDISSMRLAIVFPLHCNEPDEVYLGETPVLDLEGAAETPETVFIRDGITYLAFRPLDLTDYGRPAAVTVERVEKFLTVNFYNYQGPPRSLNFPYQAALFTQNGFVVEVASAPDAGSFADFRAAILAASLEDEIVAGIRQVHYRRGSVDMSIHYDPTDEGVIPPAWVAGAPREIPRFQATGIPELPW